MMSTSKKDVRHNKTVLILLCDQTAVKALFA